MAKVTSLIWSVDAMLMEAVQDTDGSKFKKGMIILLDDSNDDFIMEIHQAGVNTSDMLAMLETAKTIVLQEMGFVPRPEM